MSFLGNIRSALRLFGLPRERRRLVFYSEGKAYWPHLEGLLEETLGRGGVPVCFITSGGDDDPALSFKHPGYQVFTTDEGFVRSWIFENLDADVMVLTMPDLHQYQVKRSKHPVHYVYVQHSLVSLHMVYRPGAFDHYDTLFCAGPHHVREARAMEALYGLPEKNLVEQGYARLESIKENARARPAQGREEDRKHVLVAPSWGETATTESGVGAQIVEQLLALDCRVTLRPHPQTLKLAKAKVEEICAKHREDPRFAFDGNVASEESLHRSDLMVSDWSGAALDYAFGLKKPVLFAEVPRKVNNPQYQELGIEPFEAWIREKIGVVLKDNRVLPEMLSMTPPPFEEEALVFPDSRVRGAQTLLDILERQAGGN